MRQVIVRQIKRSSILSGINLNGTVMENLLAEWLLVECDPQIMFKILKTQYCPLCFTPLSYCFGLHGSEASIVKRHMKHDGQYWAFNINNKLKQ